MTWSGRPAKLNEMGTFVLEITSPDAHFAGRPAAAVNAPTVTGRRTILPRHEPFVCALAPGRMIVTAADRGKETWEIGEGAMVVSRGSVLLVVTRAAQATSQQQPPAAR